MKKVSSEHPHQHWEFVNVDKKRVLDLGCGDFGNATNFPYQTTLEFFLEKGANFVVGVDRNNVDIENLSNKVDLTKSTILSMDIQNFESIKNLVEEYSIDIVKCDIEGYETALFDMPIEDFKKIEEYYVETHSDDLYNRCILKFNECDYIVYEEIDLVHTNGICKVVFAKRK